MKFNLLLLAATETEFVPLDRGGFSFLGNKQTVTCIKIKALKLREELLPNLEQKLGLTQANSRQKYSRWERDESGRGCGCSPRSLPLPCSARQMEIAAPPLLSRDSSWRKERRRRRHGRFSFTALFWLEVVFEE
jgi:hypothetical protein